MCTDRCLATMPGVGSGSRPAFFALISSQCAGMMLKKTFPAMIVPSMAPTWRNAARGWKSWMHPQAAIVVEHEDQRPAAAAPWPTSSRQRTS